MKRVTCKYWKNVPAGTVLDDGYGGYKTAPSEDGFYTLYEIADENNRHDGWEWEKEESIVTYNYGTRMSCLLNNKPLNGLVMEADDTTGMFEGYVAYDRKLTEEEVEHYGLTYIGKGVALASAIIKGGD